MAGPEGIIDLGKKIPDDSDFMFDRIFIRPAGNKDSNKILDEFEFWADRTIQMRMNLVSIKGEKIVRVIETSFLIGSSTNVQIMGTNIKS